MGCGAGEAGGDGGDVSDAPTYHFGLTCRCGKPVAGALTCGAVECARRLAEEHARLVFKYALGNAMRREGGAQEPSTFTRARVIP